MITGGAIGLALGIVPGYWLVFQIDANSPADLFVPCALMMVFAVVGAVIGYRRGWL